jgi:hypothetical protein
LTIVVIGIALLIFSFLPATQIMSLSGTVEPQEYRTAFYSITGDVYIDINVSHNGFINFYVLCYADAIELVTTVDIGTANPIVSISNITTFQGYLGLVPIGQYAFVVESVANITVGFEVDMIRVLPQWGIFFPGAILFVVGIGFTINEVFDGIFKTRKLVKKRSQC